MHWVVETVFFHSIWRYHLYTFRSEFCNECDWNGARIKYDLSKEGTFSLFCEFPVLYFNEDVVVIKIVDINRYVCIKNYLRRGFSSSLAIEMYGQPFCLVPSESTTILSDYSYIVNFCIIKFIIIFFNIIILCF